jgi:hypothetical protein
VARLDPEERDGHADATARFLAAFHAVQSARPSDPSGMAAQLRWLVAHSDVAAADRPALEHVAAQLEAMAKSSPAGELADLAPQARALADRLQEPGNRDLAAAIASRLEELTSTLPAAAAGSAVVLPAADVARIRAILIEELDASGGEAALKGALEPGLDTETRMLEAHLREARDLLDAAAGRAA